jgi:hypothetical protein
MLGNMGETQWRNQLARAILTWLPTLGLFPYREGFTMAEREHWGPWKVWCPTNPWAMPEDVRIGDLVEAEGVVRADKIEASRRHGTSFVLPPKRFVVGTGESFILNYPNPTATHLVTRYRVRQFCTEVEREQNADVEVPAWASKAKWRDLQSCGKLLEQMAVECWKSRTTNGQTANCGSLANCLMTPTRNKNIKNDAMRTFDAQTLRNL